MSDMFQLPKHYPALDGPLLPASLLERLVGKPSTDFTEDDLLDLVKDKRIRLVTLLHVGGDGRLKALDFVPRDFSHLRDVLVGGERADGSSLFGNMGVPTGASDIILRPRLESAFLDPFSWEPALCLFAGHDGRDGKPLPESPDTILHLAYERMKEKTGIDLHALGEVEYFLGKKPDIEDVCGLED